MLSAGPEKTGVEGENAYEEICGELLNRRIGAHVSRREREETDQMENVMLRYGELGYGATAAIVEAAKKEGMREAGCVFADLGSGMGKAVISAAVAHGFEKCVGVEVLEGLYELSLELKKEFEAKAPKLLGRQISTIDFIRADMFKFDCSAADLIVAHIAAFGPKYANRLGKRLATTLRPGTFVAVVGHEFPTSLGFQPVKTLKLDIDGVQAAVFLIRSPTLPVEPQPVVMDHEQHHEQHLQQQLHHHHPEDEEEHQEQQDPALTPHDEARSASSDAAPAEQQPSLPPG